MNISQIKESFTTFQKEFQDEIAPFYEAHENSFDFIGIHGRKHISRAIVFGECMARYYFSHSNLSVDFEAIRVAIAFHDAGREGNGRDVWEAESAALCYRHLKAKGKAESDCQRIADYISQKQAANNWGQIVRDADVLEIMRLFCNTPEGVKQFRQKELYFLTYKDILLPPTSKASVDTRNQLIQEAWQLIQSTEEIGTIRVSNRYLENLLLWINNHATKFPLLDYLLFPNL